LKLCYPKPDKDHLRELESIRKALENDEPLEANRAENEEAT
jgi:hypothetical protein